MGQYHLTANLTKKEFIHPHKLGAGLKLWEQIANPVGPAQALIVLLAGSNGRGGGDLHGAVDGRDEKIIGRWAGDRVVIIGDYGEAGDYKRKPGDVDGAHLYGAIMGDDGKGSPDWRDVSELVAPILERTLGIRFKGDGWRGYERAPGADYSIIAEPHEQAEPAMRPDMILVAAKDSGSR